MFGYQACHVCAQLEHVFSVTCPHLDENDGIYRYNLLLLELAVSCESFFFSATHQPSAPSVPRPSSGPSFPDLPAVPTDLPNLPDSVPGGNSAGGEDVDFDDLTRRFEDLKKKK